VQLVALKVACDRIRCCTNHTHLVDSRKRWPVDSMLTSHLWLTYLNMNSSGGLAKAYCVDGLIITPPQ